MKVWPKVSLGEVLRLERRPVKVEPEKLYQEIGIYCFGRGIFHKAPRTGFEVGEKDLFLMKEGDFILQVTFAWEGAVALVSAAEDGMYGSTRFPTFRVDVSRCVPEFLLNYFKTEAGLQQLVKICPGSAGRNRVLSIKRISEVLVPLPPLAEQRRVVARIEELAAQIHEARALRHQAEEEAEAIIASETNALFTGNGMQRWPATALENIAEIRSGVTLGRRMAGRTVRLPYLRVANVQDGHLDLSEIKEIDVLDTEAEKWKLQRGDLLLTEGGDWDKLGRGTVWREEIPNCIHQNHIFRVRTRRDAFVPEFVARLISSPVGKAYFQDASKQTTNLASINQRQLRAFRVFQPPVDEQRRIVAELDALQAEVDALKRLQTETAAELDALLPAILDRAFKGEL
jgi:type I restriction enzyme, S subunit